MALVSERLCWLGRVQSARKRWDTSFRPSLRSLLWATAFPALRDTLVGPLQSFPVRLPDSIRDIGQCRQTDVPSGKTDFQSTRPLLCTRRSESISQRERPDLASTRACQAYGRVVEHRARRSRNMAAVVEPVSTRPCALAATLSVHPRPSASVHPSGIPMRCARSLLVSVRSDRDSPRSSMPGCDCRALRDCDGAIPLTTRRPHSGQTKSGRFSHSAASSVPRHGAVFLW